MLTDFATDGSSGDAPLQLDAYVPVLCTKDMAGVRLWSGLDVKAPFPCGTDPARFTSNWSAKHFRSHCHKCLPKAAHCCHQVFVLAGCCSDVVLPQKIDKTCGSRDSSLHMTRVYGVGFEMLIASQQLSQHYNMA